MSEWVGVQPKSTHGTTWPLDWLGARLQRLDDGERRRRMGPAKDPRWFTRDGRLIEAQQL